MNILQPESPGPIDRRQFLLIVSGFWLYVTLSNIFYAEAMEVAFSDRVSEQLFADWPTRLLQHVLMFPVVLLCYAAAVRTGWSPLWQALPKQVLLAIVTALSGRPMLYLAGTIPKWLGWKVYVDESGKRADYSIARDLSNMFDDMLLASWLASFTSFLVAYGFGLAILAGFSMYRRLRDREAQVQTLEAQWAQARLSALKSQLSPHTLFNLLHTLRGQIAWDPPAAQKMVVQLADLLRRLLSVSEREFVSLADELRYVSLYLQLQQQRFSDRLRLQLPEAAAVPEARVPSLILQPLVENAVVHGLAGHSDAVTVTISAVLHGDMLTVDVENNTAATPEPLPSSEGVGLANVRERLAVQYTGRASVDAGPSNAQNWRVRLRIPQSP